MDIKSFIKLLKKNEGFTLAEILIGGALLAGVALTGAKLFKDQKTAQKRVEHDQNLSTFHQNLIKTLSVPANCTATLKPFENSSIVATPSTQNIRLSICNSGCKDLNDAAASRGHDVTNVTAQKLFDASDWIDGTNVWQISSIKILETRTTTGPFTLRIGYTQSNRIQGNRTINKDIILHARFYNNQFKECFNKNESSVNNLQRDLCKTINQGEYEVASDGRMAIWNEELQTCVTIGNKDCTQRGLKVGPLKPDGTISCEPVAKPEVVPRIHNNPSTACPPPGRPRVNWNTSTKRMVIECI